MSKLLATLVAALFATVTVTPVAFADKHMKDEGKKEMTKGEGKKEEKGKGDEKKGEGKKEEKKGEDKKKADEKK